MRAKRTKTKGRSSKAPSSKAPSSKAPSRKARSSKARSRKAESTRSAPVSAIPDDGSIEELWHHLERWLATEHPDLSLELRPPATEREIADAEEVLGVRFPEDFRASLRVHDGQSDDCEVWWLPVAQRLGSLSSLVQCWRDDRRYFDEAFAAQMFDVLDPKGRVRQVHLHPRQIPFAGSRHWDYGRLLFDFVPGPSGIEGQVIAREDIDLRPVTTTFRELLLRTARDLESGAIKPEKW